jgi:hypothetical protein
MRFGDLEQEAYPHLPFWFFGHPGFRLRFDPFTPAACLFCLDEDCSFFGQSRIYLDSYLGLLFGAHSFGAY